MWLEAVSTIATAIMTVVRRYYVSNAQTAEKPQGTRIKSTSALSERMKELCLLDIVWHIKVYADELDTI